jgi:hypothetical protein
MAKFLSINVTPTTPGLNSGIRLINADQIVTVTQSSGTTTELFLAPVGGSATDILTLTHTTTGTTPSVKEAVNAAISAVPGGQTVSVSFPQGIVCTAVALG